MAWALGMLPEHEPAAPQAVPLATGAWHTPARQVSSVHTLPSLPQLVPSATFVCTHPELLLHESVVQGLLSLQFTAVPVHVPLWQVSPDVQALLSLHELPVSGFAAQPPGSLQTPE
jgi:hypothetical protein